MPKTTIVRHNAGSYPPVESGRGGNVQSLERAFGLLEEVAHNRDGITLSELSKRAALHSTRADGTPCEALGTQDLATVE